MRKKLVAANWKMNGSKDLVRTLLGELKIQLATLDKDVEVVIIPPALYLSDVLEEAGSDGFSFGLQNVAQWSHGAYTGEVSAVMAGDVGATYVLVGHSERRQVFGESDQVVAAKVRQIVDSRLVAVVCVGETLAEREAGEAEAVVTRQLENALEGLSGDHWENIVVAYEPVWAIGTGKTATAEDAQGMHRRIREVLGRLEAPGEEITLLYGGSVKPGNAEELFAQPDIDGGLIGGASLIAEDFARICQSV